MALIIYGGEDKITGYIEGVGIVNSAAGRAKKSEDNQLYGLPAHLIRRCHQIAHGLFYEECAAHELTPIQYGVLVLLRQHGGVDQITLAGLAALNRSTAADVLQRMESVGLLERRANPVDRRVRLVYPTAAGNQLIAQVEDKVQRVQERLLAPLTPAERERFVDYLVRIANENNELSRAPQRSVAAS